MAMKILPEIRDVHRALHLYLAPIFKYILCFFSKVLLGILGCKYLNEDFGFNATSIQYL